MNADQSLSNASATPIEAMATELLSPSADAAQLDIAEDVVRLLEERLVVDRSKRKVGEVIVRKEVETQVVEVPVRRERLIVEQVSPEYRQLAAIDLGHGEIRGVELGGNGAAASGSALSAESSTISGSFASIEQAIAALSQLAPNLQGQHDRVRIEVTLKDAELRDAYQAWFDRQGDRA